MEITTKGFENYRFTSKLTGKEYFEIHDTLSEDELIKLIEKCVKK